MPCHAKEMGPIQGCEGCPAQQIGQATSVRVMQGSLALCVKQDLRKARAMVRGRNHDDDGSPATPPGTRSACADADPRKLRLSMISNPD